MVGFVQIRHVFGALVEPRHLHVGVDTEYLANRNLHVRHAGRSLGAVSGGLKSSHRWVPAFGRMVDRKSVVSGKSVSVRVDLGGRRIIKKKKKSKHNTDIKYTKL